VHEAPRGSGSPVARGFIPPPRSRRPRRALNLSHLFRREVFAHTMAQNSAPNPPLLKADVGFCTYHGPNSAPNPPLLKADVATLTFSASKDGKLRVFSWHRLRAAGHTSWGRGRPLEGLSKTCSWPGKGAEQDLLATSLSPFPPRGFCTYHGPKFGCNRPLLKADTATLTFSASKDGKLRVFSWHRLRAAGHTSWGSRTAAGGPEQDLLMAWERG
jgi:hypothetical protein